MTREEAKLIVDTVMECSSIANRGDIGLVIVAALNDLFIDIRWSELLAKFDKELTG